MQERSHLVFFVASVPLFVVFLMFFMRGELFSGIPPTKKSSISLSSKDTNEPACVQIMPLGDSITQGTNVKGGYRKKLSKIFQENHLEVDLVGSKSDNLSDEDLSDEGLSKMDRDHEGHPGASIEFIQERFDGWFRRSEPDIVLLMIGTNDILSLDGSDFGTPIGNLSLLIIQITEKPNKPELLVASIPKIKDSVANERAKYFNSRVSEIVQIHSNKGRKVHYVDIFNTLAIEDLEDGVHPNTSGYEKMADVWYETLDEFLKQRCKTTERLGRFPFFNTTQDTYN